MCKNVCVCMLMFLVRMVYCVCNSTNLNAQV